MLCPLKFGLLQVGSCMWHVVGSIRRPGCTPEPKFSSCSWETKNVCHFSRGNCVCVCLVIKEKLLHNVYRWGGEKQAVQCSSEFLSSHSSSFCSKTTTMFIWERIERTTAAVDILGQSGSRNHTVNECVHRQTERDRQTWNKSHDLFKCLCWYVRLIHPPLLHMRAHTHIAAYPGERLNCFLYFILMQFK